MSNGTCFAKKGHNCACLGVTEPIRWCIEMCPYELCSLRFLFIKITEPSTMHGLVVHRTAFNSYFWTSREDQWLANVVDSPEVHQNDQVTFRVAKRQLES